MPITKLGNQLTKTSNAGNTPYPPAVGGILGAYRASELSADERRRLIEHHGLKENANLTARNTARGAVGATLGTALGAGIGAVLSRGRFTPSALSGFTGLGAGSYLSTNKYSPGRAKKI